MAKKVEQLMFGKSVFLLIFLVLSWSVNAKGKAKIKVDTTPNPIDGVLTGTVELNYYNINTDDPVNTLYVNPTIDYSASNGWDFQLASYNVAVVGGGAQNYQADTYINISKTIPLPKSFMVTLGTQNGITLDGGSKALHNVDYGLLAYQSNKIFNLHAGPFWANKSLTTTTDYIGFTGGFSIEAIPNFLTFTGDYFSGSNNLSGAMVNTWFRVLPTTQVYLGIGVPETNSGNEFYGALGLSVSSQ